MNVLPFVMRHYHHFNAWALKRAFIDYYRLVVKNKGNMFLAMAGAMSSARLGNVLAEAIRRKLVHGISTTGANTEESVFWLVAAEFYRLFPKYRNHSLADEKAILDAGLRRVTDVSIPEEEAFRKVERWLIPLWDQATASGRRLHWHEMFYELLANPDLAKEFQSDHKDCWLLAAANAQLPMVVPGYGDSTFGNIFAGHCTKTGCNPMIMKNDVEQMQGLYHTYRTLSAGPAGVGFFQIGGGIAGDFPICVVPSLIWDLEEKDTKPWSYFCQISDSITSYGSYSGATPNEKITWDKLTPRTPQHVIESDATIVAPLIWQMIFEAQDDQALADRLIAEYEADVAEREFIPPPQVA